MRLIKNPVVTLVPEGQGLALRVAALGTALPCTALQASLLEHFAAGADLDEVCAASPRARAARAFFEAALTHHVLLPVDERGQPVQPAMAPVVGDTFVGAPRFGPAALAAGEPTFAFLGVPWDRDVSGRAGARFGPMAVRSASQAWSYGLDPITRRPPGWFDAATQQEVLGGVGFVDAGDVVIQPGDGVDVVRGRIATAVRELLTNDTIPIVVGGDHSITRPILTGVVDAMKAFGHDDPICIVHFDAHTDLGDAAVDGAGRLTLHHGNVMTVVLEECARVERIVQIGLRGLIPRHHRSDHARVVAVGIEQCDDVDALLELIPEDAACWFSVDIDVVDPAFAPATGTPVPGGMLPRELWRLVQGIARARLCLGIDLVEVAEPGGPADGTAGVAATCLMRFCTGIVEAHRAAGADDAITDPDD
jgi:agmatinase